jgi:hypothetical protein
LTYSDLAGEELEVARVLAAIAQRGPVPSTGNGDMAVGKTLLDLLGVSQTTTKKPTFHGFVLTTRRSAGAEGNRVNLFAMVPDWKISTCKSSEEIAAKYGYDRDGGRKLYVSVRSRRANAQGLLLHVDRASGLLRERYLPGGSRVAKEVAAWKLEALQARLLQRHPASAWITANVERRGGEEYFHYRYVQFTRTPRVDLLPELIDQGTVTMDHLILSKDGQTIEKGPLFKIRPENVRALFPEGPRYDLMRI